MILGSIFEIQSSFWKGGKHESQRSWSAKVVACFIQETDNRGPPAKKGTEGGRERGHSGRLKDVGLGANDSSGSHRSGIRKNQTVFPALANTPIDYLS
jgi:hypothetical protein